MTASGSVFPLALLDNEPGIATRTAAPILVLDPVCGESGSTSILLDRQSYLIGGDAECSVQSCKTGTMPRLAVILRGQRHVVVMAVGAETWLNGLPVSESVLCDGDLLRVGQLEFRVREATPDDLLHNLPRVQSAVHFDEQTESASRLTLRRTRLSAIRARLKERRAELSREFERLHTLCAAFEASRSEFERQRDNAAGAAGEAVEGVASDGADNDSAQRDAVAVNLSSDDTRIKTFFRKPVGSPFGAAPSSEAAVSIQLPSTATELAPEYPEHVETANLVAEYMENLLGRMWAGKVDVAGGDVVEPPELRPLDAALVAEGHGLESTDDETELAAPEIASEPPPEFGASSSRRQQAISEIRAGVGSLREIANLSARTMVARHAARKLRQSVVIPLSLALSSFALAGVLFILEGCEATFNSPSLCVAILGLVALIDLAYSVWKVRTLDRTCAPQPSKVSTE